MREMFRIAKKEFRGFFATPAAYLFLGAYLAVTLFVFFWVDTFFARNIADVRPLFEWMPLLLIFLVAALTMRSWSEERRSGTLESLLTSPVRPLDLVLGKFLAALGLVALALLLTLPLPITVAFLGPLDWGPVIGGYVATLFLAAAYVAIGVYMSSRTDNPIVSLILSVIVCSLFYLIGSATLTDLFGREVGDFLAELGTGTRFQSISRGVLDLRDLYYYLSIVGLFLALNLYGLERLRWAGNPGSRNHRAWGWAVALTAANFIAANLWLANVTWARVDITRNHIYTLSDATHAQLKQLHEPLLIRAYFSAKTHPLLAPLVPQIKDLLEEYAVAAGGNARVEFIDPTESRDQEEEAASKYGIKPVPFRTASRYQSAVVNSYFDIVVSYGDQYEKLGYQNLIEVKSRGPNDVSVMLKNPEYEITRAIHKVVNEYQAGGNPFETLADPVTFKAYISPTQTLPPQLAKLRTDLDSVLGDLKKEAGNKLNVEFHDPDAGGGQLAAELKKQYGFTPEVASLTDPKPFWFYMVISGLNQNVQVPLPDTLDETALKRSINSALKRLAPGFMKTVAIVKPARPSMNMGMSMGMPPSGPSFNQLENVLSQSERTENTDLKDGRVPEDADLLLVLAPSDLDDKQRFAVDQFLMRGGSVVLATSPFGINVNGELSAHRQTSGLEQWLGHYGVSIAPKMVLDPSNASLPVPVERNLGGMRVRELRMLPYPHFPDVRGDDLDPDNPITSSLDQLTLNWVSPITVDAKQNKDRKVSELVKSSAGSWTSNSLDVVPNYREYPSTGFAVSGDHKSQVLAVALQGRFDSYYAGKESPLAAAPKPDADQGKAPDAKAPKPIAKSDDPVTSVIDRSPESARLVVVASNSFGSDAALQLASEGLNTQYTKPLDFLQNAIDWSLEDGSLLSLRGRTQLARTLDPMPESRQRLWEYLNYAFALAGLLAVWAWRRQSARADRARYQRILGEV